MKDSIFNIFSKFIDQKKKQEIALLLNLKIDLQSKFFDDEFEKSIKANPKLLKAFEIEGNVDLSNSEFPLNFAQLLALNPSGDGIAKEYANSLLNSCIFYARLEDTFDQYNKQYLESQRLKKKMAAQRRLYRLRKNEEQRIKQMQNEQFYDAVKLEMERRFLEYMQQRMDFLHLMNLQVDELILEQKNLQSSLKKMLAENSILLSNKLTDLTDPNGNKFLADLSNDQKKNLASNLMSKYDKVERSFAIYEQTIKKQIAILKSQRDMILPQSNGNNQMHAESPEIIGGAFKLHQARTQVGASNPAIESKNREIAQLEHQLANLSSQKEKRLEQVTKSSLREVGKDLPDEQNHVLQDFVLQSNEYNGFHAHKDVAYEKNKEIAQKINEIKDTAKMQFKQDLNEFAKAKEENLLSPEKIREQEVMLQNAQEGLERGIDEVTTDFDFLDDDENMKLDSSSKKVIG